MDTLEYMYGTNLPGAILMEESPGLYSVVGMAIVTTRNSPKIRYDSEDYVCAAIVDKRALRKDKNEKFYLHFTEGLEAIRVYMAFIPSFTEIHADSATLVAISKGKLHVNRDEETVRIFYTEVLNEFYDLGPLPKLRNILNSMKLGRQASYSMGERVTPYEQLMAAQNVMLLREKLSAAHRPEYELAYTLEERDNKLYLQKHYGSNYI